MDHGKFKLLKTAAGGNGGAGKIKIQYILKGISFRAHLVSPALAVADTVSVADTVYGYSAGNFFDSEIGAPYTENVHNVTAELNLAHVACGIGNIKPINVRASVRVGLCNGNAFHLSRNGIVFKTLA